MNQHPIHVLINKQKYDLGDAAQTGASLKHLAGIPVGDVLFLQRPGDDEVIGNEANVTLKNGDQLHSQPPADYGLEATAFLVTPVCALTASRCIRSPAAGRSS